MGLSFIFILSPTSAQDITATFGGVEIRQFTQGTDEVVLTYPHPNIRLLNERDSGGVYSQSVGYMFRDQLGSVRGAVEGTDWVERSVYRPFGDSVEWVDPTEEPERHNTIGERRDETGLMYLNARYYDPALGHFLSPDWFPVEMPGVGPHRYHYSLFDPINLRDPNGNAPDYGYGVPGSFEDGDRGFYVGPGESRSSYQESLVTLVELSYDEITYDGLSYPDRLSAVSEFDFWTRTNVAYRGSSLPSGPENSYTDDFVDGAASLPLGVARCFELCGSRQGNEALQQLGPIVGVALDSLLSDPQALEYVLNEAVLYARENPSQTRRWTTRIAGQQTSRTALAAAVSSGTGPILGTATSTAADYTARLGNLNYYAIEAMRRGYSLSTTQALEVLATGMTNLSD